ncbi:MAG TPA: serine/threonine-protein kinase [Polyangiaceae bacterium]|nr:serine/threonine-protein kinase [Polyangiaceae bacterium]
MNAATSPTPNAAAASDIRCLSGEGVKYAPGTWLNDKLELLRLRGRGGMGEVWVARHHPLDIEVAVKVIRSDRATSGSAARLLREARSAASLSHPAVARVLDFGRTADLEPYIVMELLHGETLADFIDRQGGVPAVQAVRVLLPIVHALLAAHERSLVHRDLKPENIFLSLVDERRIQPKLLDFGIALSPGADRTTGKRRIAATPEYAAPEQTRGGSSEIDARTDIWALCLVLYETITQLRPFQDSSSGTPALRVPGAAEFVAEDVEDAALRSLIERGMRQDPSARFHSMLELGEALGRWLISQGVADDVTGTNLVASWPNLASDARVHSLVPVSMARPRPFSIPYTAAETSTMDGPQALERETRASEPSLLAPRPSSQPEALEPLSSPPPSSQCARWRAWGLCGGLLSLMQ